MKNTVLLFALLLTTTLLPGIAFGQSSSEKYDYVTKGYQVQIESGIDMKKGYEFENIDKYSTNERAAELKVLYRVKDGKRKSK
jgi:hypothetical protein